MIRLVAEAFVSGAIVEAIYALGVLFIGDRKEWVAGLSSFVWGNAFLVGLNDSFGNKAVAEAWCVGLCAGTVLAIKLEALAKRRMP